MQSVLVLPLEFLLRLFIQFLFLVVFFLLSASLLCVFYTFFSGRAFIHIEPLTYTYTFLFFIGCCAMSLGMMRYNFFISFHGDENLKKLIDQKISAEGIVTEEPAEKDTGVQLTVTLTKLTIKDQTLLLTPTKVLTKVTLHSHVMYGDELVIQGELREPEDFLTDTGKEFDYKKYLAKDKIFYEIKNAQVTFIRGHQGNFLQKNC